MEWGGINLNLMVNFDIKNNPLYICQCIIMINKSTYQEVIELEVDQSINPDLFYLSLLVKFIFIILFRLYMLISSNIVKSICYDYSCGQEWTQASSQKITK